MDAKSRPGEEMRVKKEKFELSSTMLHLGNQIRESESNVNIRNRVT